MGNYFLAINEYEVLMSFNVPTAHSPHGHAVCLQVGDIVLAIEGDIYVKMDSKQRKVCSTSADTHVKAIFDEKFIASNPKIFRQK